MEGLARFTTAEASVTPQKSDWPVYDEDNGRYESCRGADDLRESMLELSTEEAASLQLVNIYCDYKRQRGQGGRAPTAKLKKLSVVRVEWKAEALHPPTARARAAYLWLRTNHETYARFHIDH